MGTNLSKNLRVRSSTIFSLSPSPIIAEMSSSRLPDVWMANLAPFLIIQLCFSPKAASQAAQSTSGMGRRGSLACSKVTRMKVNNHIILNRLRAVELYFLKSLGALWEELLSPLSGCNPRSISSLTKERKPRYPLKVLLLLRMISTLDLTSEKAMPRKELSAANARQN